MRKELSLRKLLRWILVALLLYVAMVLTTAGAARAEAQEHPALPSTNTLQFTSAGHVVGFQPQRLYLAALDHALSVEFLNARAVTPQSDARGAESAGAPGAPPLSRVSYPELWPGITLVVEATESGIAESTFLLQPQADAAMIRLQYDAPVTRVVDGSLEFELRYGHDRGILSESAPVAWQDIGGRRVLVPVEFTVSSQGVVGLDVGEYDPRLPLTIDPLYQWHTFSGSDGDEYGMDIAVDAAGNIYVTGYANGTWLGDGNTAPRHAPSGQWDIFVLKLSSAGAYQWHTFYGSNGDDYGYDIAVDAAGTIYVTGRSYADWQGDGGTNPLHHSSGGKDLTVLKLSSSGAYAWHTFYGSASDDFGYGIAADGDGNVYVTGGSAATWQGDGNADPLHPFSGANDGVVLKLSPSGAYVWHTFFGSNGGGSGKGIALDNDRNIYIVGSSNSSWLGEGNTNPLHVFSGTGCCDFTVVKLSSSGAYQWHTFFGGNDMDFGESITLGGDGNVYVTGYSYSTWQGDSNTDPLHAFSGATDGVVLKLSPNGAYLWHTFYGSSDYDYAFDTAVDSSGVIYIAGLSWKSWQGDGGTNPLHAYSGQSEIMVLRLSSSGAYQWHTFYGSSGYDGAYGIIIDAGKICIVGASNANWQGDGGVAALHPYNAGWNAVILKLDGEAPIVHYTNFLSLPIILNSH